MLNLFVPKILNQVQDDILAKSAPPPFSKNEQLLPKMNTIHNTNNSLHLLPRIAFHRYQHPFTMRATFAHK
ncbi:hypothetical protein BCS99_15690 [Vibrio breoganii]|nr:hypothetical protein BCT77_15185 [Vibrio breoganii]PML60676.1 hypothetical protein BCT73_08050 [Vibrio breoganii]PMO76572.1 hypothetical protein BCT02_01095 [Vibrio breoganii]PMO80558.1 hypothetical protein BCT00_14070 [Vibrio breoganii]PMO84957.1 hypothetical protein BCS99_15690 [Vibrio breoganii]